MQSAIGSCVLHFILGAIGMILIQGLKHLIRLASSVAFRVRGGEHGLVHTYCINNYIPTLVYSSVRGSPSFPQSFSEVLLLITSDNGNFLFQKTKGS